MLRYRKGVLYYKTHPIQDWREVPKDQYAMRWEQQSRELEIRLVSITDKYKAVTAELESLSEQFNLTEQMLHKASKDNLAKNSMIKYLEARINKGAKSDTE